MSPQKIDQQQTYPCICSKHGHLKPIVLTDAFGCDRCSAIFVIEGEGDTLVQVDGIDPYQRAWHWHGSCWQLCRRGESKALARRNREDLPSQRLGVKTILAASLPLIVLLAISPVSALIVILFLGIILSVVLVFMRLRR